jgi:hypothetical protein
MARVRDVEIHEVPEDVQPVYERFSREYGPFLNQVKVFAHRPAVNECTYCVSHHAPRLVEQGLEAQTVEHILAPDCPGLDEVDRLVRDYAVQVTEKPNGMRDAIFADLRKHFSEEQIVELTVRTALCGFFNRVNDTMQIGIVSKTAWSRTCWPTVLLRKVCPRWRSSLSVLSQKRPS